MTRIRLITKDERTREGCVVSRAFDFEGRRCVGEHVELRGEAIELELMPELRETVLERC